MPPCPWPCLSSCRWWPSDGPESCPLALALPRSMPLPLWSSLPDRFQALETSNSPNFTVQMGVFRRLRRTFQPSDSILPVLPGDLSQSPEEFEHFVSNSMACGATPNSALSQSAMQKTHSWTTFFPFLPAKLHGRTKKRPLSPRFWSNLVLTPEFGGCWNTSLGSYRCWSVV